jgi:adhesin/invasin
LREGAYFVDIIKEGQVELRNQNANVRLGQVTQNNVALTAPVGEGIFRIVTSWTSQVDNAVRDVDSYLSIPNSSGYINYQNMRGDGADLDRDDRDWIGPETMTIRSVQNGKYVFYVDNFSDRTNNRALGNSQIQVIVYKGSSEVRTYRVPEGAGLIYEVFNIVNGNVIDVERYNSGLKVSNNR